MLTRFADLEVPEDEPWKNDRLGRKAIGEMLTKLVSTAELPLVLTLSARWGTGKTTFVRMWKQHLMNGGYPCLFFNAWETDFVGDPLIAFIGEITQAIETHEVDIEASEKIKHRLAELRAASKSIAQRTLPVGVKLLTAGLIDTELISDDIGKALSDAAEKYFDERLDQYEADKSSIDNFRQKLTEFIEIISPPEEGSNRKPLVFFIDELDRCRPDFAVELLERIKHLFDVPGLAFILSVDRSQLEHTVKALYGPGTDARDYLRKFITLDFRLPDPEPGKYGSILADQLHLQEVLHKLDFRAHPQRIIVGVLRILESFNFSLRQQQHFFLRFKLALHGTQAFQGYYATFIALLICLRMVRPEVFSSLKRGDDEYKDEIDMHIHRLEKHGASDALVATLKGTLEAQMALINDGVSERENAARELLEEENVTGIDKLVEQEVRDLLTRRPNWLGRTFEIVELTEQFSH